MNSVKNLYGRARKRLGQRLIAVMFSVALLTLVGASLIGPVAKAVWVNEQILDTQGLFVTNIYSLTNATASYVTIAATAATNWTGTNVNLISLAGATAISFEVDGISTTAAGTLNNGRLQFFISKSMDDSMFETTNNAPTLDYPSLGTQRNTWVTNFTGTTYQSVFGAASSCRLTALNNTNSGPFFFSNVVVRVTRTVSHQ